MTRTKRERPSQVSIVVRAFEPADAPIIAPIVNETSVHHGTLQLPMQSVTEVAERWAKPDPLRKSLVVEVDGQLVAIGSLTLKANLRMRHVASIGMMVAEGWQGRGIGGRLLDALLELGERWCGVLRFDLDVWVDNVRGIQLYRSRGFAIEGIARALGMRDGKLIDAFRMARVAGNLPWQRVTAEGSAQREPPRLPPSPKRRSGN